MREISIYLCIRKAREEQSPRPLVGTLSRRPSCLKDDKSGLCRNNVLAGLQLPCPARDHRQTNLDLQTACLPIRGCHLTAVEAHSTFRDRQAESDAACLSLAGIIEPIKRLKQLRQSLWRNTWARVAHPQYGFINSRRCFPRQFHVNGRSFLRVADRVTDDILHRTMEQRCVAADFPITLRNRGAYMTVPRLCFELGIFRHTQHNFIQSNRRLGCGLLSILKSRQGQNSADQLI